MRARIAYCAMAHLAESNRFKETSFRTSMCLQQAEGLAQRPERLCREIWAGKEACAGFYRLFASRVILRVHEFFCTQFSNNKACSSYSGVQKLFEGTVQDLETFIA